MTISERETMRQIDALKVTSPTDDSTRRALAATRAALMDVATAESLAESPAESLADDVTDRVERSGERSGDEISDDSHRSWRRNRIIRGVAIGGTAVSLAFVTWLLVSAPGSLAFAQVQNEMKRVHTVRYTFVAPSPDGSGKLISVQYVVSGSQIRADWPGKTQIEVPKRETMLVLDHKERTATFTIGRVHSVDKYQWLTTVEDSSVKNLGTSTIDGQEVVGFEMPERGSENVPNSNMKVWVDPDTRLPVKIVAIGNRILQDFIFDAEVQDEVFALEVPEGYFVERRYKNPPTQDIKKADLEKYEAIVSDAKRTPLQTVDAFLKLAGAGKQILANKLLRNPSPDDLREMDGYADLRIESVYSTDNHSLVVTNTAISDRGEKRGMLFELEIGKGGWIIDDIDMASAKGMQEKTQDFRMENPKAVQEELP